MNLTIPIMDGQFAQITVTDSKIKEMFLYSADHKKVQVFKKDDGTGNVSLSMICVCDVKPEDTLLLKGIGRNKRKCKTNLNLEDLK